MDVVDGDDPSAREYRLINAEGVDYRTPRAGEPFRVEIFGRKVAVPPRDRRKLRAVSLGFSTAVRGGEHHDTTPHGALYLWQHPDEDSLFRAIILGVYNEVLYARSPRGAGGFEWLATWETMTVPTERAPWWQGKELRDRELEWGYARLGLGAGYRRALAPGNQENMFAVGLTAEPGFLYFERGDDTADAFVSPRDTFEARLRLRVRADAMERNLMELPHRGVAYGGDLVMGYRDDWGGWGMSSEDEDESGRGRRYAQLTAYGLVVTPVPFMAGERHRLIGSVHAGMGEGADRFSAQRIGGGPWPQGQEYGSTSRPVLLGTVLNEFVPDRYCVGAATYRWEPLFFIYLSLDAALAYVDEGHRRYAVGDGTDRVRVLGARVTTGFVFQSRLQIAYAYNFDAESDGDPGGHALVTHVSRRF